MLRTAVCRCGYRVLHGLVLVVCMHEMAGGSECLLCNERVLDEEGRAQVALTHPQRPGPRVERANICGVSSGGSLLRWREVEAGLRSVSAAVSAPVRIMTHR